MFDMIKSFFAPNPRPKFDNSEVEEETRHIREKMHDFHQSSAEFENTVKEFLDKREWHHRNKKEDN